MIFNDTPNSMIEEMLAHEGDRMRWETGWQRFFEIYHPLMRLLARNGFTRYNFNNVPESAINDVVSDTFIAMIKTFQGGKFDKNAHFRGFLKSVISNKCVDYMRKNKYQIASLEFDANAEKEFEIQAQINASFQDDEEEKFFKLARIREILECLRTSFSPQTITIFELIKLEGKSVKYVMKELEVSRTVVDNSVYKVMKKLKKEIANNNIKNYDNEIL